MKVLRSVTTAITGIPVGGSLLFSRAMSKFYNTYHYLMTKVHTGPELRIASTYDYASPYQTTEAQFTNIVPAGFEIEAIIYHHRGSTPQGLIQIGTTPGGRDVVGESIIIQEGSEAFPIGNSYFGNQEQTLYLSESPSWTPGSELAILIIMRDKLARIPWK